MIEARRCSFCGKAPGQVGTIVQGPGGAICEACVDRCNQIIEDRISEGASISPEAPWTPEEGPEHLLNALRSVLEDDMERVCEALPEDEQAALLMRWGLSDGVPKTIAETSSETGLAPQRLRRLERRALKDLLRARLGPAPEACSFCLRPREAVRKLVEATSTAICETCVELCIEVLLKELGPEWTEYPRLASDSPVRRALLRAMQRMPEGDRQVLRLRYGLVDGRSRTITAVTRELGMTRERVLAVETLLLEELRSVT